MMLLSVLAVLAAVGAVGLSVLNLRYALAIGARLQQGYQPARLPAAGDRLPLEDLGISVDAPTIVLVGESTCLACKKTGASLLQIGAERAMPTAFIWADEGPLKLAGASEHLWFINQRQLITKVGVTSFPFVFVIDAEARVQFAGLGSPVEHALAAIERLAPCPAPTRLERQPDGSRTP